MASIILHRRHWRVSGSPVPAGSGSQSPEGLDKDLDKDELVTEPRVDLDLKVNFR